MFSLYSIRETVFPEAACPVRHALDRPAPLTSRAAQRCVEARFQDRVDLVRVGPDRSLTRAVNCLNEHFFYQTHRYEGRSDPAHRHSNAKSALEQP